MKPSLELTTAVHVACVCAGLFLCHVTARSSFPTTINVSYFLNSFNTGLHRRQLKAETIIKEEFEPVMGAGLHCLTLG